MSLPYALRSLVLALVLMGNLPHAEAQESAYFVLHVDSLPDEPPIVPVRERSTVQFNVTMTCSEATSVPNLTPVTVEHSIDVTREWLTVTWEPHVHDVSVGPDDCVHGLEERWKVNVTYGYHDVAPAYSRPAMLLQTTTEGAEATGRVNLTVGFTENYRAIADQTEWVAGEGELVDIPVDLENRGNGPILVRVWPPEATSDDLQVQRPAPLIVDPGQVTEVTVSVRTPQALGHVDQQDNLVIMIEGHSTHDPGIEIRPVELSMTIRTTTGAGDGRPIEDGQELPTLGAPFIVAALMVGLLCVRSRRH